MNLANSDPSHRSDSRAPRLRLVESQPSGLAWLIAEAGGRAARRPANTYLFLEGEVLRPLILVEGWVSLQRMLKDGRRQIFNIALPGDLIGCPSQGGRAAFDAVCLTPCSLADASQLAGSADGQAKNAVAAALADAEGLATAVMLDHIMRLGRLTSFERVGHFLLSVDDRLSTAGLSKDRTFALPVTQEVLADYLGLSIVHINRTLQQLKREGLIERQGNLVTLKDREGLAEICHYTRPDLRRRYCA